MAKEKQNEKKKESAGINTCKKSLETNIPQTVRAEKRKQGWVKTNSGKAWNSEKGYLQKLPREKIVEMVKRGAITRKKNKLTNPVYGTAFSKCFKCEFQKGCPRAFEEVYKGEETYRRLKTDPVAIERGWDIEKWLIPKEKARCVFEMEARHSDKNRMMRRYKAFCSNDPNDLLAKLSDVFKQVEELNASDPSFGKAQQTFYMLTKFMELKNKGKKSQTNIQINSGSNTSIDIKGIMDEMRENEAKAIEDESKAQETNEAIDITQLQRPTNETTQPTHNKGEGSQKQSDDL